MRPHPPTSPTPGYPVPPLGPRPGNGKAAGGCHTQLPRPGAPVPPNVPGLNRAKMDQIKVTPQALGANNPPPVFREPAPPSLPANTRYDRAHMYKQATKLPDITDGMVTGKPPKPRRLVSIDSHYEPAEVKELKFPAIPGATECPHTSVLQPIPRARPITPKCPTYQTQTYQAQTYQAQHFMPAPPPNPKKQIHRVKPLHSQLQRVSSVMEAGPCRAPTPIESASYDPAVVYSGASMPSTMNGVRLDLPSPVSVPHESSPTTTFKTAQQERVLLSPSMLGGQVSPVVSASRSNKALDDLGAQMLKPVPPKGKNGNHGGGGGARRRHYRS